MQIISIFAGLCLLAVASEALQCRNTKNINFIGVDGALSPQGLSLLVNVNAQVLLNQLVYCSKVKFFTVDINAALNVKVDLDVDTISRLLAADVKDVKLAVNTAINRLRSNVCSLTGDSVVLDLSAFVGLLTPVDIDAYAQIVADLKACGKKGALVVANAAIAGQLRNLDVKVYVAGDVRVGDFITGILGVDVQL